MKKASRAGWSAGLLLLGTAGMGWAQTLTLEEYLQQVQAANPGLKAARAAAASAGRMRRERELLTSPYAFAEAQKAGDWSRSLQPMYEGDARSRASWTLGLEEQTLLGTRWRLFHRQETNTVEGADPAFLPFSAYTTCKTGVEVIQDLWRNGFGRSLQAVAGVLEAQSEAAACERRYQARQIEVKAEMAYGKLALAREVVSIQAELLERSERLAAWVEDRVALKLQDRSDLMQAQAQTEALKLELAAARDQAQAAAQAFNLLRAQSLEVVAENLTAPAPPSLLPELAAAPGGRLDVRAQEAALRAAVFEGGRKRDALSPEVQLNAALYLNGLDPAWSPAFEEARQWDHRAYAVGLQVRVPLDWFARSELSGGYDQEVEAAQQALQQRRQEAESEWRELRRRLPEYQARWNIARNLESLQMKKADYERQRLKRGNSLLFQVLQFEQEWAQSRLARVQVEDAILELLARVKLFEEL